MKDMKENFYFLRV